MYLAPSIAYPLSGAPLIKRWTLAIWLCAIALDIYWFGVSNAGDWRPWLALFLTLTAALAAMRWGAMSQSGMLVWDAKDWCWENQPAGHLPGNVTVHLDLQRSLLLRFVPHGGPSCWFWLQQSERPEHWLALRRAVYGSAGRGAGEQASASGHWRGQARP